MARKLGPKPIPDKLQEKPTNDIYCPEFMEERRVLCPKVELE